MSKLTDLLVSSLIYPIAKEGKLSLSLISTSIMSPKWTFLSSILIKDIYLFIKIYPRFLKKNLCLVVITASGEEYRKMIEKYLYSDWEEPPEEMSFVKRFDDLISELRRSLDLVLLELEEKKEDAADYSPSFYENIKNIYLLAPALPNVILNYKICIDFGLPIDPVRYVDFNRKDKNPYRYAQREKEQAGQLFKEALSAAKLAYALSPDSPEVLSRFCTNLPETVKQAEFTNRKDVSTWMASNPEHITRLAEEIKQSIGRPNLIVGAAHGSICPGLLLSNLLGCDLYFVRFSFFKREDRQPIISDSDKNFFSHYPNGVIIFDEDMATGQTMRNFAGALTPFFTQSYSAAVLRFYLASFQPDFTGKTLYDK